MMNDYNALVSANKEAMSTFAQFNTTYISGLQEISDQIFALAQNAMKLNLETVKSALEIKSPQDLAALQSKWASQFVQSAVSGSAKLSEISAKIATQAAEPVQLHIRSAVSMIADNVTSLASKAA